MEITMETTFDEVRAQRCHKAETVFCESVGEYTLPDYLPEVRKLLRIETRLLPAGQFVGTGKAEFTGTVIYTILYSDENGKLASTVLNGDYRFTVPVTAEGSAEAIAESRVDRVTHRLSGPRRISIRASIASDVRLLTEEGVVASDTTDDSVMYENLAGRDVVSDFHRVFDDSMKLTDSYRFDGVRAELIRPISSCAAVFVKESRPQNDGIYCSGEIWVKFLYAVGDASNELPETLWRNPFTKFPKE